MVNKILCLMIILLLLPMTLAETFTTDVNIEVNNYTLKVSYGDTDYNFDVSSGTLALTVIPVSFTGDVSTFNYSKITELLNVEELKQFCSEEIDQAMADQQSYFSVTYLPSKNQLDELQYQLKDCTFITENLKLTLSDRERAIVFMNESKTETMIALQRENKTYTIIIVLIFLIFSALILYQLYLNKQNGQSLFKWSGN